MTRNVRRRPSRRFSDGNPLKQEPRTEREPAPLRTYVDEELGKRQRRRRRVEAQLREIANG